MLTALPPTRLWAYGDAPLLDEPTQQHQSRSSTSPPQSDTLSAIHQHHEAFPAFGGGGAARRRRGRRGEDQGLSPSRIRHRCNSLSPRDGEAGRGATRLRRHDQLLPATAVVAAGSGSRCRCNISRWHCMARSARWGSRSHPALRNAWDGGDGNGAGELDQGGQHLWSRPGRGGGGGEGE